MYTEGVPELTDQQREAVRALDWLLDQSMGSRRSGRTLTMAVALVRQAARNPGTRVRWIDHYSDTNPRQQGHVIRPHVESLIASDPRISPHVTYWPDGFRLDGPAIDDWMPPPDPPVDYAQAELRLVAQLADTPEGSLNIADAVRNGRLSGVSMGTRVPTRLRPSTTPRVAVRPSPTGRIDPAAVATALGGEVVNERPLTGRAAAMRANFGLIYGGGSQPQSGAALRVRHELAQSRPSALQTAPPAEPSNPPPSAWERLSGDEDAF